MLFASTPRVGAKSASDSARLTWLRLSLPQAWVPVPPCPLPSLWCPGQSLGPSEPQCPDPENGLKPLDSPVVPQDENKLEGRRDWKSERLARKHSLWEVRG